MSLDSELIGNLDAFFHRNGFDPSTRSICDNFISDELHATLPSAAPKQGYCSYTVAIDDSRIVQFRPRAFRLKESINTSARQVLGDLVPRTEYIAVINGILQKEKADQISDELHIYLLDRVSGTTFDELQTLNSKGTDLLPITKRLLRDLGVVFARTYVDGTKASSRDTRKGKVGSSLAWRLQLLQDIESEEIRAVVDEVQENLDEITDLPWCLTHGDLVPANVMVDPSRGSLRGLIDWAEGEYLPFGLGLYGVEELLGSESNGAFQYHPQHGTLREVFWNSFQKTLDHQGVTIDSASWDRVLLARKLGILLWRGIAFEDGRIDRVVKADVDDSELRKLHLFLAEKSPIPAAVHDRSCYRNIGFCFIEASITLLCALRTFTSRIFRYFKQ
jgi:hypothetical protein